MDNLKLLFQLYLRPGAAMSELMDRGSWLVAAALVAIVAAVFFATVNSKLYETYRIPAITEYYQPGFAEFDHDSEVETEAYQRSVAEYKKAMASRRRIPIVGDTLFRFFSLSPDAFYQPLLSISIFYIPALVLLLSFMTGIGSFGLLLRRDYGTLATCSLTAWAAAHLPFAIAGIVLHSQTVDPAVYLAIWAASGLLFGVFMIFALRTIFGVGYTVAAFSVASASLSFTLAMYASEYISPWLLSPFILFWAFIYFGGYLGGEVRGFGNTFRQRQNFKRFLHNATVNPKDADAHVQLGLIYIQRRQEAKAVEHLKKALEIDPTEIDANYELGRIARSKGNLQMALDHFSIVVEQNDKHSLSEIWREIGVTYLSANMLSEALDALNTFIERRPYDPEGLYYLGKVLKAKGESEAAREAFEKAIDSVKGSPDYRRRSVKQWSRLAEKEM